MPGSLLFLFPVLIALGMVAVHYGFAKLLAFHSKQMANQKFRNAILEKKVMHMLENEKKHWESLKILEKKIEELRSEIAIHTK